ncbi:MarR family winged helix-turn-helix transcriptional regulator [Bradyrhizobium sp. McL0615]|uniref:MarR family winged helix-turn-helix transcriptional regulator n=1 Tax=Bradyrhizobium sp. McL0615 TaxID=3415673 RepID=UPI003CEAE6B7
MLRSKQDRKPKNSPGSHKRRVGRKSGSAVNYEALAEFRFQLRRFLAFSKINARKNNLTSQQYQALLTIKGLSGPHHYMSVGELADFLLVKHHTAVGLIDRMAKSGLLKRFRDSSDGRRIQVMLTRKGEQQLSNVAELNWAELRSRKLSLPRILKSFS